MLACKRVVHLVYQLCLKRALWSDIFTGRLREDIPPALKALCNAMQVANARLLELDLCDNAFGPVGIAAIEGIPIALLIYQKIYFNFRLLAVAVGVFIGDFEIEQYGYGYLRRTGKLSSFSIKTKQQSQWHNEL